MGTGDPLSRHFPIWFISRFGRTRSGGWVVRKYAFIPRSLLLLAEDRLGFQSSARAEIPAWSALLVVYATIFIPVLFAVLIGINVLVWTKLRLNHVFIFGE